MVDIESSVLNAVLTCGVGPVLCLVAVGGDGTCATDGIH